MTTRIEHTILSTLLLDEVYTRKVLPFLSEAYFPDKFEKIILEVTTNFFTKYNKILDAPILKIEISSRKDISEKEVQGINDYIDSLSQTTPNPEWLLDQSEKFCKEKAVYNAILDAIEIIDGKDKKRTSDSIPSILSDALGINFDTNIGHDYINDSDERYEFYHRKEEGIPFDLTYFNKITDGVGLRKKTLSCISGVTGSGKSIFMVHCAARALLRGSNVLYITLEMSEKRIAERIDANLLNVPMGELKKMDEDGYKNRLAKLSVKTNGTLIIKEYPTSTGHAGHFRALLDDLKSKKSFVPDLVVIDYLNICASSRLKANGTANSYTYVKSIAEEIRGLAVEFDVPILTGTQVNRNGIGNSDISMSDTSESMGLVHSLDLYFALIATDELTEMNQVMIKQLKNRYGDENYYKRFILGLDKSRMKFYDVEESAQDGLSDSGSKDEPGEETTKFRGKKPSDINFVF